MEKHINHCCYGHKYFGKQCQKVPKIYQKGHQIRKQTHIFVAFVLHFDDFLKWWIVVVLTVK